MFSNKFDGDNSFNLLSNNSKLYTFLEDEENNSVNYDLTASVPWLSEIEGAI